MIFTLLKSQISVDLSQLVAVKTWSYTISQETPRGVRVYFKDGDKVKGIDGLEIGRIDASFEFEKLVKAWEKYRLENSTDE